MNSKIKANIQELSRNEISLIANKFNIEDSDIIQVKNKIADIIINSRFKLRLSRLDSKGMYNFIMNPESSFRTAEEDNPILLVQNNLLQDKVLYWLAIQTSPFRNGNVSLSSVAKAQLLEQLADGIYTYGNIPPNLVIPYLKFSPGATWEIQNLDIPDFKSIPYYQNIIFMYEVVKAAELDKLNFTDFFQSKSEQKSSWMQSDGFPIVDLNIFHKGKHIVSLTINSYGIKNPYLFEGISKLYSLPKNEYLAVYTDLADRDKDLIMTLYLNNQGDNIKYNSSLSKTGTFADIVNLPQLLAQMNPNKRAEERYSELLPEVKVPEGFDYTQGGKAKIIQYLSEHKDPIYSSTIEMVKRIGLPFNVIKSVLNKLPPDLAKLGNTNKINADLFLYLDDETTLSFLGKFPELDNLLTGQDSLQNKLADYYFKHSEQLTVLVNELRPYPDLLAIFQLANKNIPVPSSIHNISNINNLVDLVKIIVNMLDYDLPGRDIKNKRPYPSEVITYIQNIINNSTEEIYPVIGVILDIKEDILDGPILLDILRQGYIYPLPISKRTLARDNKWKRLTPDQVNLMKRLYSQPNLTRLTFRNISSVMAIPELLIEQYHPNTLDKQINDLGIVVPHNVPAYDYFASSLKWYDDIGNRGKDWQPTPIISNLNLMTDIEIVEFVLLGYPGHSSREELISRAVDLLSGKDMFVLVANSNYVDIKDEEKINNPTDKNGNPLFRDELFVYSSRKPSLNPLNLLFRYTSQGKGYEFTISELKILNQNLISQASSEIDTRTDDQKVDDLEEATSDTIRTIPLSVYIGQVSERHNIPISHSLPDDMIPLFTLVLEYARFHLDRLVSYYSEAGIFKYISNTYEVKGDANDIDDDSNDGIALSSSEGIDVVQQKISDIKTRNSDIYKIEKVIAEKFLSFSHKIQLLIVEGLVRAFDCGMIQRQWKGVRGEYPMEKKQTGSEEGFEGEKDILVGNKLHQINEIFVALRSHPEAISIVEDLIQQYSPFTTLSYKIEKEVPLLLKDFPTIMERLIDIINDATGYGTSKKAFFTNLINQLRPLPVAKTLLENYATDYAETKLTDRIFINEITSKLDKYPKALDLINAVPFEGKTRAKYLDDILDVIKSEPSKLLENLHWKKLSQDRMMFDSESLLIRFADGTQVLTPKTLKILYDDIRKGEARGGMCIRMGSFGFIVTSYYWLKLFGREKVLGKFDITKLDFIY